MQLEVGLNQLLTDLVFGLCKLCQLQALVKALGEHEEEESKDVEPEDVMLFGCVMTPWAWELYVAWQKKGDQPVSACKADRMNLPPS